VVFNEYTLPFVRHLRSKFHIDVDWVELSLLDQFEAVAVGKGRCSVLQTSTFHDGLVQCTVLFEEKKKLVVPADHRLCDRDLNRSGGACARDIADIADNHQLGAWRRSIFLSTPLWRPIARGPVVTTIRECLAVAEIRRGRGHRWRAP